jgi:hypothetical protein
MKCQGVEKEIKNICMYNDGVESKDMLLNENSKGREIVYYC